MSIFDVLDRHGTRALLRLFGALAVFLLLHLLRIIPVLIARVLECALQRVDEYAATLADRPPPPAVNHFYPTTSRKDQVHARA